MTSEAGIRANDPRGILLQDFCLPQQKLIFTGKMRKTWKNVFCIPMIAKVQAIVNRVLWLSRAL